MAPSDDDGHEDRARPGDGDCLAGRAEYGPPPRRTVKTSSRGSSGPRRWHVHRNNSTLALRAGSHQPSCVIVVRGGIGSPGGRTAAPVRSVVKQPRRPTNCGGTDSPLVDELALCRRDCSPARGSPQPPQPTSAPRRRGCFSTVRTGAKRQPCCRCGADTVGAGNSGREGRASHLRDTCR